MRLAAIDLGDTRTGVAFSDISLSIAGESLVIKETNGRRRLAAVADALAAHGVTAAAVGRPINMDGSPSLRSDAAEKFSAELAARLGIPVRLIDERRTTIDSHRILSENGVFGQKRKDTVDAVAASLILEIYIKLYRSENGL